MIDAPQPCPHDPFCTNPAHTRADSAPDHNDAAKIIEIAEGYFTNGEPLRIHPALAADMKVQGLWDDAKHVVADMVPINPAPDLTAAYMAGFERGKDNNGSAAHIGLVPIELLAAANAEIAKLREAIKGAHILSNHATRMIKERDTTIAALTDALRKVQVRARANGWTYVEADIYEALALAEKTMGGE